MLTGEINQRAVTSKPQATAVSGSSSSRSLDEAWEPNRSKQTQRARSQPGEMKNKQNGDREQC